MTGLAQAAAPSPVNARAERVRFAVRQASLLGAALLVAGLVTEQLRPDETSDRGIASTQFMWAIVIWAIVLLVNAIAFERSQMRMLERVPLAWASAIGSVVLLVGLASFNAGPFGRRFVYLLANSIGAAMFWWAMISLGWLITRWVSGRGV